MLVFFSISRRISSVQLGSLLHILDPIMHHYSGSSLERSHNWHPLVLLGHCLYGGTLTALYTYSQTAVRSTD